MLHITHDQTESRIMADRIAIIMDGKTMQAGVPEEIFEKPVDSRVASFVGFENIMNSRVISADSGLLRIEAGEMIIDVSRDINVGSQVHASLRPEK